jgi:hypothetical protein
MGEVPDMARQVMTIGTRHCEDLLKLSFCHPKGGSKRPAERYFRELSVSINGLRWSDPDPIQLNGCWHSQRILELNDELRLEHASTYPLAEERDDDSRKRSYSDRDVDSPIPPELFVASHRMFAQRAQL